MDRGLQVATLVVVMALGTGGSAAFATDFPRPLSPDLPYDVDVAALGHTDDVAFCEALVTRHGVAAIPVSAFYPDASVRGLVRLCFAKDDATLDAALDRMRGLPGAAA